MGIVQTKPDMKALEEIIARRKAGGGSALAVLSDVQKAYNYIPQEAFGLIAEQLGEDEEKLRRQASFYSIFTTDTTGRHIIRCCNGPCCTARNRQGIIDAIRTFTGMPADAVTSPDGNFSIAPSGCMKNCGDGPVVTVDNDRYLSVTPGQIPEILKRYF